ncbi:MAG: branched-chain amino acid ABC transporter permease, partial [Clostridiales bacterium]|nr:branched-chain amino acid ABC transporter permease [Clostridiales bacterium]
MKKSIKNLLSIFLIVLLYGLVFLLEQVVPRTHLIFTVLAKGAIYSLVAVSMNLLNGFTGLFSLGQAGFMLIGAYTYAIFTIPTEAKASVYKYYDCAVNFSFPELFSTWAGKTGGLILGVLAALIL